MKLITLEFCQDFQKLYLQWHNLLDHNAPAADAGTPAGLRAVYQAAGAADEDRLQPDVKG